MLNTPLLFIKTTVFLFIFFVFGCSKHTPTVSLSDFQSAYQKASVKEDTYRYDRRMVHLGIPTSDTVVFWYIEGKRERELITIQDNPQVKIDGVEIANERVKHFPFDEYRSGRIEVSGLTPDQRYQVLLKLFPNDPGTPLTAWTTPLPSRKKSFSFLAFSCYQPFIFNKKKSPEKDEYLIFKETTHVLNMMNYRAEKRTNPDGKGPSFFLGLGDQIYIDPEATASANPYALLWGLHSEKMRYGSNDPKNYLDELYRRYFSLPPFDAALSKIPGGMIWDDHEIRDGWGSQKDEDKKSGFLGFSGEYIWKRHIESVRKAAFAFEFSRNPGLGSTSWDTLYHPENNINEEELKKILTPIDKPTNSKEFYFQFEWAAVSFFVMDLRSQRNYKKGRIISNGQEDTNQNQLAALKEWFARSNGTKNKLLILGSSVPLTVSLNRPGRLSSAFSFFLPTFWTDPYTDDIVDKWSSNSDQQRDVLQLLTDHFGKNPTQRLLVLSGDIHSSQLVYLELFDKQQKKRRVFGHELISSGLAQKSFDLNKAGEMLIKKKVAKGGPNVFSSHQAGIISEPNFAEIFITYSDTNEPPQVSAIFYPATNKRQLVNLGPKRIPTFKNGNLIKLEYTTDKNRPRLSTDRFIPLRNPWGTPHDQTNSWFWPKETDDQW